MIRLLLFLIIFPFAIILFCIVALFIFILFKLNIIKQPFKIKTKMEDIIRRKKSFTEATISQLSCKHQNLEQKDTVLLCSDCGKIIANN